MNKYTLGLAALLLSSCATYKTIVVDKTCIGQVLSEEDPGSSNRNITIIIKLGKDNYGIKEFADKNLRDTTHIGSTLNVEYRQLCKVKYKKNVPRDTIPIPDEQYIRKVSYRDQLYEEIDEFYNMEEKAHLRLYCSWYGKYFDDREYKQFKKAHNKKVTNE